MIKPDLFKIEQDRRAVNMFKLCAFSPPIKTFKKDLTRCAFVPTVAYMAKQSNGAKWTSLRISVDLLERLRVHCEELGQRMSIFAARAIEKEMDSKKAE